MGGNTLISQLQEEGLIKVRFMRSEDNRSDIATKNVTGELYETHTGDMIMIKSTLDEG